MILSFLDVNIPIYAAGRPHPLKEPCIEILDLAAAQPLAFVTDSEALQELLHHYLAIRHWSEGKEVLHLFLDLMQGRIEPVQALDVERAGELADSHAELGGRDLVHTAVMQRLQVQYIISADRGFDRVSGIERLDPANIANWRETIVS